MISDKSQTLWRTRLVQLFIAVLVLTVGAAFFGSSTVHAQPTPVTIDFDNMTMSSSAQDIVLDPLATPMPLRFTIGAPGEQTSQVTTCTDLRTENFDRLGTGSYDALGGTNTGVYRRTAGKAKFEIVDQNEFGGADQPGTPTRFISTTASEYTLTLYDSLFPGGAGYFGFWWSAGDGENQLEITRADGSVETFSTQSILNSPALQGTAGTAGGHFGNPTAAWTGDNPGEAYAFVNIFAQDDASRIKSVRFTETGPSSFESDNHTACADLIDRTDQGGADLGGIVIRKTSGPAGGTGFGFTDDIESPNSFSLDDGQDKTFLNAIPGTYTVAESDPSATPGGYTLTDIECVDGDPGGDASSVDVPLRIATILLDPNETVTCTFRNEGPRDYGDAPDSYGTTLATNGAYHFISANLHLGAETDAEGDGIPTANADGDDLDQSPDDEDAVAGITDIAAPDTLYLVDNINVTNNTGGAATLYGWIDFNRNGVFDATEKVSTPVSSTGSHTVFLRWDSLSGVRTGQSYLRLRLSDQDNLTANGPGGSGEVEDYPVMILAGGRILITKRTAPNASENFQFTSNIPGYSAFSVYGDGSSVPIFQVAPGSYTVTEDDPGLVGPGYELSGLRCDDGSSATPSTVDIGSRTATINLDPGERLECVFTNSEDDHIVIEKVTVPAGGVNFDFVITDTVGSPVSFSLDHGQLYTDTVTAAGTYTITELDSGPGYDLTDVSCDGGGSAVINGDTVLLDLPLGGIAAHCTFTNTARSTLRIIKQTLPSGAAGDFDFTATGPGGASPTIPPLSAGDKYALNNLLPGTWNVAETVPTGWDASHITCISATKAFPDINLVNQDNVSVDLTPGDDVTCLFINAKHEHITINKVTDPPGGQGFGFNSGAYMLNDGDNFTVDIGTGPFTVIEDDPAANGYALTGISCTDNQGDTSYTIDLDARQVDFIGVNGLVASCTYTNTVLGSVIIEKVTEPALTDSFTFIAPISHPFLFALRDGETQQYHNVLPGRYRVTEFSPPAGIRLADIRCDDGNSATPSVPIIQDRDAIVNVDPGETVKCTFTNVKNDTVVIEKRTLPAGDTSTSFGFTSDLPTAGSFSLMDSEAITDTAVTPSQTYYVEESNPSGDGYELVDITCHDTNSGQTFQGDLTTRRVSFTPEAGHTIYCTFTNQAKGRIVVHKATEPSGASETFDFVTSAGSPSTFTLGDGQNQPFEDLQPGQYTVEELPGSSDYRLSAINCVDSEGNGTPSTGDPANGRATINVDPGETVECTFINAENDTVLVQKFTDPPGGTGFGFTSTFASDPSFTLDDGQIQTITGVAAGQPYTVTEDDPTPAYDLVDASCFDTSNGAVYPGDVANRLVTFTPDPGHVIYCAFLNQERGSITIAKETTPAGNSAFDFTLTGQGQSILQAVTAGSSETVDQLAPGAYTLTEVDPDIVGYALTSIECLDDRGQSRGTADIDARTANIQVGPGENVTCTFENLELGEIRIRKTVESGPAGPFDFLHTIDNTFAFQLNGGDVAIFSNVMPGAYSVLEFITPDDSGLKDIVCDDGASLTPSMVDVTNGIVDINVDPGETVECEFVNAEPKVRIVESYTVTRVEEGKLKGGGSIACYWVTLATTPGNGEVVIDVGPPAGGEVTVNKSQITLDANNWDNLATANRSNFVCVRAVDDKVDESGPQQCWDGNSDKVGNGSLVAGKECGDHTDAIPHQVASSTVPGIGAGTGAFVRKQPDQSFVTEAEIPVLVQDNDTAGVHITESFALTDLDENGAPVGRACYWLNLISMPSAPVTIDVTVDAHVLASKTSVTLDANNWDTLDPQNNFNKVCLTPVDDPIINPKGPQCAMKNQDIFGNGADARQVCGDYLSHVGHSVRSGDGKYAGNTNFSGNGPNFDKNLTTIDALIRDDNVAKVLTAPIHLNVVEGSSAALGLKLSSQPAQPVTVSSNAGGAISAAYVDGANSQQVTFDSTNWDQEQNMTIQIPENDTADGVHEETVTLSVDSADVNFKDVVIDSVSVVVVDNDSAGVALSSTHLELSENGGEGSYQLSLTSQPAADLTITLVTGAQVTADPSQVTFTPANWQQAQTIRVTVVDDTQVEANGHAGLIRHTVASADLTYNGITVSNVGVAIEDNDTVGMSANGADDLRLSEGAGSVVYSLRLNARPGTDVTVSLNGGGQVTTEPAALTFTPENWNQTQAVSVKAVDDAIAEGGVHVGLVSYSLTGDPAWQGLPVSEQVVTIADNDRAGLRFSTTSIQIGHGAADGYTVSLMSQPREPVLVWLTTSGDVQMAMAACDDGEESGPCLLFDAANWDQPQDVTVRAYGSGQVKHALISSDAVYNELSVGSVGVNTDGISVNLLIFLPVVNNR